MYYALSINIPFGIVTCIIALATRYGENGSACALPEMQETRAFFLSLQIVCLVVYIPTCFAHVIYLKLRGVKWCHEQYLFDGEEEEPEKPEQEKE